MIVSPPIISALTLSEQSVASRARSRNRLLALLSLALIATTQLIGSVKAKAQGLYSIDRQGVVERSDIILQRPNELPSGAMPLGNGRLGIAVWSQDGLTAQLNRVDTFPRRLSPGQIVFPNLAKLAKATDYKGRLNLYTGEFEESGAGITLVAYVDEALDVFVVDVKGADPKEEQTVMLRLWQPRKPQAVARKSIGALAETWLDDEEAGAGNERFGSLAAVTADAKDVRAVSTDRLSVTLKFMPNPDGSFRVLVGAPSWRGGNADVTASSLLTRAKSIRIYQHRAWWSAFWAHAALMKLSSPDHRAEYFENLRSIYLFTAAAESRDRFPGSQAGVGDLFSSARDEHKWGPSAYWHWNLRMQVSANLGAGASDLNSSYFRLYRENLDNILNWTRQHMGGRQGACVPETMRFNGRGYENETWLSNTPLNCAEDSPPYYNARTISTGAEVSLWIWEEYEYTDDLESLRKNYPLMRDAARFLLAYATTGTDGKLHTFPSNAHENQWDVHDPITDLSAMRTLFPHVIEAATILKTDPELITELRGALTKLMPLPFATVSSPTVLLKDSLGAADAIITSSYNPDAKIHNVENLGLEPAWPYAIIGDDEAQHKIAIRTFLNRSNKNEADWSYDPVQAARLGLSNEFTASLFAITNHYQVYPSGLAAFSPSDPPSPAETEFYVEQVGVLTDALQKALADDYNDLIRIAPAWPQDWDADGTVYLPHGNKVDVRVRRGELVCVGFEVASREPLRVRNPWPGQMVEVIDARNSSTVLDESSNEVLAFSGHPGGTYLLQRVAHKSSLLEPVSATPATTPKSLGSRTIGLAK